MEGEGGEARACQTHVPQPALLSIQPVRHQRPGHQPGIVPLQSDARAPEVSHHQQLAALTWPQAWRLLKAVSKWDKRRQS